MHLSKCSGDFEGSSPSDAYSYEFNDSDAFSLVCPAFSSSGAKQGDIALSLKGEVSLCQANESDNSLYLLNY